MSPLEIAIYNLNLLQAGFMAMDIKNGEVKAWAGGINHEFFEYDHVTANRQVGSTFKPFFYLAALEEGICPCQFYSNEKISNKQFNGWTPGNTDHKYEGRYSLKGALTHSINTVSARLISEVGIQKVSSMARKAGIKSELPQVASLALGTAELSLFELIQAYQTIAIKGQSISPKINSF